MSCFCRLFTFVDISFHLKIYFPTQTQKHTRWQTQYSIPQLETHSWERNNGIFTSPKINHEDSSEL